MCCVLGANPPYGVIEGFIRRIWKDYSLDKVALIKKGLYLVRFTKYQGTLLVVQMGICHFDHKPFIVKAWTPEMKINTKAINSLPIRVQLSELDIRYWRLHSLSKLGSMLDIPLKTDKFTKEKSMLKYARLLVEMRLDGSFPNYIEFSNEKNVLIRQNVLYEWIPLKCSHCKMFAHTTDHCRKKEPQRREWRVRNKGT